MTWLIHKISTSGNLVLVDQHENEHVASVMAAKVWTQGEHTWANRLLVIGPRGKQHLIYGVNDSRRRSEAAQAAWEAANRKMAAKVEAVDVIPDPHANDNLCHGCGAVRNERGICLHASIK